MRAKIRANRSSYDEILCLYGDCGTGGELDRVLEEEGVRAHRRRALLRVLRRRRGLRRASARKSPARSTSPIFSSAISTRSSSAGSASTAFRNCATIISATTGASSISRSSTTRAYAKAKAAADRLGLAFERRFTGLEGIRASSTARQQT